QDGQPRLAEAEVEHLLAGGAPGLDALVDGEGGGGGDDGCGHGTSDRWRTGDARILASSSHCASGVCIGCRRGTVTACPLPARRTTAPRPPPSRSSWRRCSGGTPS